jgi:hypothetical protein
LHLLDQELPQAQADVQELELRCTLHLTIDILVEYIILKESLYKLTA